MGIKGLILALFFGFTQPGEVITITSHYECFNVQGYNCKEIFTVFRVEKNRLVMIQGSSVNKFEYTAKPRIVDGNFILTSGEFTFILDPVNESVTWRGVILRYYP